MRIAVCDDCRDEAQAVADLIPGQEVQIYNSGEILLSDVEGSRAQYDLYLLDIYMKKGMSGIELAERLRLVDEGAAVCFISTSDGFYREAYDLYAVQYLIKPVREEALRQLLNRVEKHFLRNREKAVCWFWRKRSGSIPYGKILFISSRNHTLTITCADGRIQESSGKLNDLEKKLDQGVFCRCHQSFLVNLWQADSLDGYELTVASYRIPISRRYYREVKRRYHRILFEEVEHL